MGSYRPHTHRRAYALIAVSFWIAVGLISTAEGVDSNVSPWRRLRECLQSDNCRSLRLQKLSNGMSPPQIHPLNVAHIPHPSSSHPSATPSLPHTACKAHHQALHLLDKLQPAPDAHVTIRRNGGLSSASWSAWLKPDTGGGEGDSVRVTSTHLYSYPHGSVRVWYWC